VRTARDLPLPALMASLAPAVLAACIAAAATEKPANAKGRSPYVQAASEVDAGRYLTLIGGCNDCHTLGYEQANGQTPEDDRLTGGLPWRGPWGTSFPANLRLVASQTTPEQWVRLTSRTGLPPMPWLSLHNMEPGDLKAIHAYLKHLGPKGEPAPTALPPGAEPAGPYIDVAIRGVPAH